MKKDCWGIFVCSCEGRLNPEADSLKGAAQVCHVSTHPRDGAAGFAREAKEEGVSRVMISCCQGIEAFESAFAEAGFSPFVHSTNLKQHCFLPHPDPVPANRKALRMLRGAMRAAERAAEIPENYLQVGQQILLATDRPEGMRVAEKLAPLAKVRVVVDGSPDSTGEFPADSVNWGRLASVEGRLGSFTAAIERIPANGGGPSEPQTMAADQIVIAHRNPSADWKPRTGLHILTDLDEPGLEQLRSDVSGLTGSFMKPEYLSYLETSCAGGAAQTESCGRCITHCPYSAIARDSGNPLRIRVDHLACEGCGACTAACPTSALQFTDPVPEQLYGRLAGLLADPRESGPESASELEEPPPVVAFHCPEMGKAALELAGESSISYSTGILPVEVPCLRHVSMATMLAAFRLGAAGVALLGCEDCPHGERNLLLQEMDLTGRVLDAFEMDGKRVRMFTAEEDTLPDALPALHRFASQVAPSPISFAGLGYRGGGNRQVISDAIETFITQLDREPGGLPVKPHDPFAFPDVNEERCTLCRSCANVCPTHAFRFDPESQSLSLKTVDCMACGLCEGVCPEDAIHLRREFYLERSALENQVVVQDETIQCAKCGLPYINKKALELIESRVLGLESLLDTFAGNRQGLLRMCPDCRAVLAMQEVEQGWVP